MNNLNGILNQHVFSTTVDHSGSFSGVRHFNNSGRLHMLESGTVKIVQQGGSEVLLDRPSIVLLPTAVPHRLEAKGDAPVSLISASVSFCLNNSSMILKALPDMMYLQVNPGCSMSCTVQWLFKEVFEQRFGKELMINKLGEIFMLQMLRHATEQGSLHEGALAAINHPQMRKVIDAIHTDPGYHWTLNGLASIAAMSRSKFAECFKSLVGQTPNDYITDLRLARAQKLLKSDKPVNFVASEVGYEHGSALVRIFKKKLGVSPRQWLQQARQSSAVLNA
ncbi:helix-turn-helix domain-containing protein [Alteromonas gilva]|uniref:AraC family transcriptional regulator n=1 Tax=Alteromonas gilva TaxID=2987522 RepID=A0ABT5KYD4_9ALTE|nr:AraC family transcriptional regulator [Alteromonas gilva]MDC8829789.1 AraC family transcriptional regulator [Alteromonas gilva]